MFGLFFCSVGKEIVFAKSCGFYPQIFFAKGSVFFLYDRKRRFSEDVAQLENIFSAMLVRPRTFSLYPQEIRSFCIFMFSYREVPQKIAFLISLYFFIAETQAPDFAPLPLSSTPTVVDGKAGQNHGFAHL